MKRLFLFLFLSISSTCLEAKPMELVLWHSLAGDLGQQLRQLAHGFNQSQTAYAIKPIYKGDYLETITSFSAAFQAKQPPALVQVFEVGTATMLSPPGIIKPVDELMKEQGMTLPEESFFPSLRAYYSEQGRLMAMPFNTSVPVIFYNADALAKVGYSAKTFPKSLDEMEVLASKLKQAGYSCVYTSTYPAWILIEAFSAIHGLPLADIKAETVSYNSKALIHYLERLLRWQDLHYFEYGGRMDDAMVLFTSGRCPLLSQSSGSYNSLSAMLPFHMGVAALPMDTKLSSQRFNNVTGGAAFWAVSGQSPTTYKGIALFFKYLSDPSVQKIWQEKTGYLPLGVAGVYKDKGHKKQNLALALAESELMAHALRPRQRLGAQNQIRIINDEALEAIFARIKTPKQAMDDAAVRANHVLARFRRNTTD